MPISALHNFNSHAHVERDFNKEKPKDVFRISTHTLTWSVTNRRGISSVNIEISTHTLTWSVTCACTQGTAASCNFNSHAHVERDEGTPIPAKFANDFNSHAHVERDSSNVALSIIIGISTHTLTWSVTMPTL